MLSRIVILVAVLASPVMAQLPPLPGSYQQQQQYQERLRQSQEFMDRSRQEHEWLQQRMRDQETLDKLDRLHRDLEDE